VSYYGDDQIRAVREATDLVAVFSERTKVQKAGADHVACCPFHQERTPSLHIYADQGRFHCFGCKEHGDAIDVVRKLDGLDFEGAVEVLARRAGIRLVPQGGARAVATADDRARRVAVMEWAAKFYADQLGGSDAAPARAYLQARGFTAETLDAFAVGWAPGRGALVRAAMAAGHSEKDLIELDLAVVRDGRPVDRFFDRITIPICDRRGHCIAFTARLLPEAEARAKAEGRGVGKYVNTKETPLFVKGDHLFNMAAAQQGRRLGRCFVVEGQLDVLASHQAGVVEVVATQGTAFTPAHAAALGKAIGDAALILALDGDAAGREATDAAMATCLAAGLMPLVGELPGGKDAAAILSADGGDALKAAWAACQSAAIPPAQWLRRAHPLGDRPTGAQLVAILDRMLAVAATLPDSRIVEIEWLQLISDHLAVPLKTVRESWKRLTKQVSAPAAGEAAPAAQQGGEGTGDYAQMVGRLCRRIAIIGATPDAMCGWITPDESPADLSDSEVQLEFAHHERMSGQRLLDNELKQASQVIFNGYRKLRRAQLLARLVGRPSTDAGRDALRRWLIGATGECRELDFAVMAHFLWQVKRMATGQIADWPLIPVLFGNQEVGKSTAIERLCHPLAELSFPIDATAITDERKSLVITRALVGRLDEMAGMAKADQEKLKAMATANRAMFRELYSMSLQQRRRTCSFIASSNMTLDAIVTDTTGNRRFWQVDCLSKDWEVINAVDPLDIWQAASELEDTPIRPFKNELKSRQKTLIHQDVTALWMRSDEWDQLHIRRADTDQPTIIQGYNPAAGYSLEQLAARAAYWARGTSNSVPNLPRLKQRLHQEGFEHRRISMPGGKTREWRWFVPQRFLVDQAGDNRQSDWGGEDKTTPILNETPSPKPDFP
jgi:DNA primase